MRIVKKFILGDVSVATFLVEHNNEYMLIDCGKMTPEVLNYIKDNEIEIKYILLTHSHFDHIEGIDTIKSLFKDAKVVISDEERAFLKDPEYNLSNSFSYQIIVNSNALTFDQIDIDGLEFKYVRGHSKKSTVIIAPDDKIIFSGDTVFHSGVGRSDFYYGDRATLIRDIKTNIFSYGDDFIIYPGHGAKTSVGYEKKNIIYKG